MGIAKHKKFKKKLKNITNKIQN